MKVFLSRFGEKFQARHPVLFWVWNAAVLLLAGIGLGVVSLWFAKGPNFDAAMFRSYFANPWILLLNLAPVVLLLFFLWAATKRTWVAFLITAVAVEVPTLISFYKLAFRNDPMLMEDILLIREAGNMTGSYQLFFTGGMALALVCILLGTLFLFFFCRGHIKSWRRLVVMAAVLVCAIPIWRLTVNKEVYQVKTSNDALISAWSDTELYLSKGFLYPFLYSATQLSSTAPANYSSSQAQALLEEYEDRDIPADKRVNVVAIMLEAFQDFSRFGTPELAYDLYAPYHQLEAESYTGDLITNIFAGGTVNTERCFLTGYSQLSNFRVPTNAYPWYFQSQGYQVTGMHPSYQWFYNRENVNRNLGFQDYYYVENYFTDFTNGYVAYDDTFFPLLIDDLTFRQQEDAPIFSFSVTYQGHGPYDTAACSWGDVYSIVSQDAGYSPEAANIMANYFGSLRNTMGHLLELRDFLAAQEEPYVLVLFGDHNPWMGDGNTVYAEMGLNLDLGTLDGVLNYYGTRYLIWANDAAKEVTGNDFVGEGPALGPYFLMTQLFDLCGWEGPAYLQATRAVSAAVPVHFTSGIYLDADQLLAWEDALPPEESALVSDFNQIQYYYHHHFHYGQLTS